MTLATFPWRGVTLAVLAVCGAALIVWDIIVATNRVEGDTISELTLTFLRTYPVAGLVVALALGIILGHLTWPMYVVKGTTP